MEFDMAQAFSLISSILFAFSSFCVDGRINTDDLNLPRTLMQRFGHADCGVYAEVVEAGAIALGDPIMPEAPRLPHS